MLASIEDLVLAREEKERPKLLLLLSAVAPAIPPPAATDPEGPKGLSGLPVNE